MPQDADEFQSARSLQGSGGTSCRDVFEQMIRLKHRQVQSPLTERRQRAGDPREDQGPGRTEGARGPPPRGRGQVNRTRPTAPLHINHRQGISLNHYAGQLFPDPRKECSKAWSERVFERTQRPLYSPYHKVSGFGHKRYRDNLCETGGGGCAN